MDANSERILKPGDFQPWYLGEPNGNDEENCGVSWIRRGAWNDEGCGQKLCGFCQLKEAPVYTLKGTNCTSI